MNRFRFFALFMCLWALATASLTVARELVAPDAGVVYVTSHAPHAGCHFTQDQPRNKHAARAQRHRSARCNAKSHNHSFLPQLLTRRGPQAGKQHAARPRANKSVMPDMPDEDRD